MEKQLPFREQIVLRGADYRAVKLVGAIMLALVVTGVMLVALLGRRNPVTQSLLLGFNGAVVCLYLGSLLFYLVRQIGRWREEDPLTPRNLRSRLAYERDCARQLTGLEPADEGLERATLELQAQTERYAGYTGARNEFFRSYKELLLAGLLIFGITSETATGELITFILTIKWLGALFLLSSFWAGMFSSAKVSKYKFWLSVVALARYQMRLDAANSEESTDKI
ncbi:MAG: hypothetical protein ACJ754_16835 [Pyrinomonadaceae bacterium]